MLEDMRYKKLNIFLEKFIYSLIVLNVVCLILESFKVLRIDHQNLFETIEIFSIGVFTVEFFVRLIIAEKQENKSWRTYFFSGYGLLDLLSILPFYLPLIFPFDLRMLRVLRLLRIVRIFKLGRYSKSFKTINLILKETKPELLITAFIAFILIILSSTFIFYAENEAQPDKFSSIIEALWWSLGTLTTVGADVSPITPLGKFLSALIGVIGIGFVALPTGIISSALIDKVKQDRENCHECPHCGLRAKED
ncbi:Cation channel family protein [Tenacibaculum jejuense]|uniref:Cation channel family protein n=2 Tax=Tenacibaculum jejuense TaxID=584609 RepID=A0A238U9W0_9FLAO|nr:Cation channel family protein [Tenacibaculum jejuense]